LLNTLPETYDGKAPVVVIVIVTWETGGNQCTITDVPYFWG